MAGTKSNGHTDGAGETKWIMNQNKESNMGKRQVRRKGAFDRVGGIRKFRTMSNQIIYINTWHDKINH